MKIERTEHERDKCTEFETAAVRTETCPDCACALQEGPHGGLSVNWICVGRYCGSRFNMLGPNAELGVERISDRSPRGETLPWGRVR